MTSVVKAAPKKPSSVALGLSFTKYVACIIFNLFEICICSLDDNRELTNLIVYCVCVCDFRPKASSSSLASPPGFNESMNSQVHLSKEDNPDLVVKVFLS